jgi:hypothetical protein
MSRDQAPVARRLAHPRRRGSRHRTTNSHPTKVRLAILKEITSDSHSAVLPEPPSPGVISPQGAPASACSARGRILNWLQFLQSQLIHRKPMSLLLLYHHPEGQHRAQRMRVSRLHPRCTRQCSCLLVVLSQFPPSSGSPAILKTSSAQDHPGLAVAVPGSSDEAPPAAIVAPSPSDAQEQDPAKASSKMSLWWVKNRKEVVSAIQRVVDAVAAVLAAAPVAGAASLPLKAASVTLKTVLVSAAFPTLHLRLKEAPLSGDLGKRQCGRRHSARRHKTLVCARARGETQFIAACDA